jgi:molecular chaperone DnaK
VRLGGRAPPRDNRTIGKFQLTGIPPAQRGMPQVEVTFDIDANGILHVAAKDKATGKEQKIRVEASSGLSDSDIDKMVKDAEKNAEEDKKRREEIDTRNRLDSLTYEVEKNSKEWSDKLPEDLKTKLDASVERARKALRGDDMNEIRAAQEELSKTFGEAGQSFYAQNQAPEGGAPEGGASSEGGTGSTGSAPGGAPADDVVEADYEIVDDAKK